MQADQLYSLEDEDFLEIPQIRGMPVPMAVESIRGHIAAMPSVRDSLCCVCDIYACLIKKGVIGPWVLYNVPYTQCELEDILVIRYMEEMQSRSGFAHSMNVRTDRVRTCALVPQSITPSVGHDIYGFCFWTSSASVAVFRPPEGYSHGQHQVLVKMFGANPAAFECGVYDDLDSADDAATSFAPGGPSTQDFVDR